MIGFRTLSIVISSKCTSVADPFSPPGQDLILTPLSVFVRVHFETKTPDTGSSPAYLSKLLTLMPCPGPHFTFVTVSWDVPSPTEMQSSPVPMLVSRILTTFDFAM